MENRFAVSLHDVDQWKPTDEERQAKVVKQLMHECESQGTCAHHFCRVPPKTSRPPDNRVPQNPPSERGHG